MRILKFGGTSVGNPEIIKSVIAISTKAAASGPVAVVVSAYTGVTNELLALAELAEGGNDAYRARLERLAERHFGVVRDLVPAALQSPLLLQLKLWVNELGEILQGVFLVRELSLRTRDAIMSFGERLSAYTIAQACSATGTAAQYVDARELIRTDASFGCAQVDFAETGRLLRAYFAASKALPIVTGFIGATVNGVTTTLGRGGSDYTAAILGSALSAAEIEIWTDVDGMYTADPRKVARAFPLPAVSYEEAQELCHFGAKVIYPPTLAPAMQQDIPLLIKNTFRPQAPGTRIERHPAAVAAVITGIASISAVSLLRMQGSGLIGVAGTAGRMFGALAKAKISVILITQASSEHTICCAVQPQEAVNAKQALDQEFALEIRAGLVEPAHLEPDLAIVSVVGENMRRTPGVSACLFHALGRNGINVVAIAQGSSELNISVVLGRQDEAKALNAIHDAFFLSWHRTINVFLCGTGLIGKTLIKQIAAQAPILGEKLGLDVRIVGVRNQAHQLLNPLGIPAEQAFETLQKHPCTSDVASFVQQIRELNLPSSVFVDCTASEEVARQYQPLLEASIALVTPSKRAQAGEAAHFSTLKQLARKRGVAFLYEASVGAGLPIIGTLNDLLRSGDSIVRIEAVLSGTLSFIFNSLSAECSFSRAVTEARQRGYTEPDPRDDLNGLDAARKLVILARECGLDLDLSQVQIEPLLSAAFLAIPTAAEFLEKLPQLDAEYALRVREAQARSCSLRYVGVLENGKAQLALRAVPAMHPLHALSGNDNMVIFTTERYRQQPLVVKGPGAGAEVTAAAVFADIIRIAS